MPIQAKKIAVLLILALATMLLPGRGPAQVGPIPSGGGGQVGEIYLTKGQVTDTNLITGRKTPDQKIWVPSQEKIKFGWTDQPFAINIPFDLETEVRTLTQFTPTRTWVCSKKYQVTCTLTGFTYQMEGQQSAQRRPLITVEAAGIYRLDGQLVVKDGNTAGSSVPILRLLDLGEKPYTLTLDLYNVTGPGRMALYFIIGPSSDVFRHWQSAWGRVGESCSGKLRINVEMEDQGRRRVIVNREMDLTIKQNGWQLNRFKVTDEGDWKRRVGLMESGYTGVLEHLETKANLGPGPQPAQVTSKVMLNLSPEYRPGYRPGDRRRNQIDYTLEIPSRFYDHAGGMGKSRLLQHNRRPFYEPQWFLTAYQYDEKSPENPGTRVALLGERNPTWVNNNELKSELAILPAMSQFSPDTRNDKAFLTLPNDLIQDKTLPYSYHRERRIPTHRLIRVNLTYPLDNNTLAVKHIDLFAARLSDLESNQAGGVPLAAPTAPEKVPDDGYWQWQAEFSKLSADNRSLIKSVRDCLQFSAQFAQLLRQKWNNLFRLDMLAHATLTGVGGEEIQEYFEFTRPIESLQEWWQGSHINLTPAMTKERLEAMKRAREKLADDIHRIRPQQQKMMEVALKALAELQASVQRQAQRSGDRRPHLQQTLQELKDEQALLRVYLFDDTQWLDEMEQAIKELKLDSQADPEVTHLLAAKVCLARAAKVEERLRVLASGPAPTLNDEPARNARAEACKSLRQVLRLNPNNQDARQLLLGLEMEMVAGLAAKLDAEKELSLEAFHKYLADRGYDIKDPKGWWDGSWEFLSVALTTGPISHGVGYFGGIPDKAAEQTAAIQTAVAKHQVSLIAIRRLQNNGLPLQEIWKRTRTPDELTQYMTPFTVGRAPLEPDRLRQLSRDIYDTFNELPELAALAAGETADYMAYHSKVYYRARHPEKSRLEMISDLFLSPLQLAGCAAGSVVKMVNGRWVAWSPALTVKVERAGRLPGLVLYTGAEELVTARAGVAAYLSAPERLGNLLSESTLRKALQDAVLADQALLQRLPTWRKLLFNDLGRMGAFLVIYGGAGVMAEQYHATSLKFLLEALKILGPGDLAYDILANTGKQRRILEFIARAEKAAAEKRAELAKFAAAAQQLETLGKQAAAAPPGVVKPPSTEIAKNIDQILANLPSAAEAPTLPTPPSQVPSTLPAPSDFFTKLPGSTLGANPKADLQRAVAGAAQGLKAGDGEEALRAVQTIRDHIKVMEVSLNYLEQNLQAGRNLVTKNPEVRQIVPRGKFEPIVKELHPEQGLYLGRSYSNDEFGQRLFDGDVRLLKRNWDEGRECYRAAIAASKQNAKQMEIARNRLALLENGHYKFKLRQELLAKPDTQEYVITGQTPEQLKDYLEKLPKDHLAFLPGSMNPVYQVYGKDPAGGRRVRYIFKELQDEEDIFVEEVGGLLFNQGLKGHSPQAVALKDVNLAKIDPAKVNVKGILTPYLPGSSKLAELSEPQILAMKEDLAKIYVFSAWIGNNDIHGGNILVTQNGKPCPIDFGLANLRRDLQLKHLPHLDFEQIGMKNPTNQKELMETVLKFSTIVERFKKAGGAVSDQQLAMYRWIDRIRAMMSFNDLEPAIVMIENLCRDNGKLLRPILQQSSLLTKEREDIIVKVLTERGTKDLREVLKKQFIHFKTSSVLPFKPRYAQVQPAAGRETILDLAA